MQFATARIALACHPRAMRCAGAGGMPARPPAPGRAVAPRGGGLGGGGQSGFPAPGPAILPELSPGSPCRLLPVLGGLWPSPSLSRGSCSDGSKRTRLSSDARLPGVFTAPRPPGISEETGAGGGRPSSRAAHAAGVQARSPHVARADGLTVASSLVGNGRTGPESVPGAPRQLIFLSKSFSGTYLGSLGDKMSTIDFRS